jgi:hypothetical protein
VSKNFRLKRSFVKSISALSAQVVIESLFSINIRRSNWHPFPSKRWGFKLFLQSFKVYNCLLCFSSIRFQLQRLMILKNTILIYLHFVCHWVSLHIVKINKSVFSCLEIFPIIFIFRFKWIRIFSVGEHISFVNSVSARITDHQNVDKMIENVDFIWPRLTNPCWGYVITDLKLR